MEEGRQLGIEDVIRINNIRQVFGLGETRLLDVSLVKRGVLTSFGLTSGVPCEDAVPLSGSPTLEANESSPSALGGGCEFTSSESSTSYSGLQALALSTCSPGSVSSDTPLSVILDSEGQALDVSDGIIMPRPLTKIHRMRIQKAKKAEEEKKRLAREIGDLREAAAQAEAKALERAIGRVE